MKWLSDWLWSTWGPTVSGQVDENESPTLEVKWDLGDVLDRSVVLHNKVLDPHRLDATFFEVPHEVVIANHKLSHEDSVLEDVAHVQFKGFTVAKDLGGGSSVHQSNKERVSVHHSLALPVCLLGTTLQ
jgi:hypothetical protein